MARPLQPKTEFLINGTWTDVTSDVFGKSGDSGSISIQHGMADQQGNVSPDSCTFTLDNRTGAYSNRYPLSPYYGKIPRNTQVRHSVPGTAGDMDLYSRHVEPDGSGLVQTADKASLDIVGDIDVRIEITPAYGWRPPSGEILAAKYVVSAGNRSWFFLLGSDGKLQFWTSTDGNTLSTGYGSAAIPIGSTRLAVRFTLDVDLGGTQKVSTFYTSDSIGGTWAVLSTATSAGITSIFAGGAPLEIGSGNGGNSPIAGSTSFIGKVHGFELYSGIAGTLVADYKPNRSANVVGSTTWADTCAAPNTWSVVTKTRVTSDRVRAVMEMTNLPLTWDLTKRDVQLAVQAYGALRRITRGAQPIHSPIYRNLIAQIGTHLYFPMEDGSSTLRPQAAVGDGPNTSLANLSFSGSAPDGLPGSAGAVTLNTSTSYLQVSTAGRAATGTASFVLYFKLAALPASDKVLFTARGQGTGGTFTISVGATGYAFAVASGTGTALDSGSSLFGTGASPLNQWIGMQVVYTTVGPNVSWTTNWHVVGTNIFFSHGTGSFAGTVGRFNIIRADVSTDAAFVNMQTAHWLCTTDSWVLNTYEFADSSNAFIGESVGTRMRRLAAEENMNVEVYGDFNSVSGSNVLTSPAMGAQRVATVLDLFADCYKLDGGVFGEARDRLGFVYYCASFFGNRRGLVLSESSSHLAEQPTIPDDDRYLINDYTATNQGGGSARTVATDTSFGPNNILDPPDGVGRSPGGDSFNAATDDQMQEVSQFQVFWRTWDEPRIPNLKVGLHRTPLTTNTALTRNVLDAYLASPVQFANPITIASFDALNMSILGYTETTDGFLWFITFNTVPQGPYNVGRVEMDDTKDGRIPRAGTPGTVSVLNAGITSTATSFVVNTTGSVSKWIVGSSAPDFPITIMMGGELMSVGQIGAAAANLQTFSSVTRSVNGVVKAQTASTPVLVRDEVYLGMSA